MTVSDTHVDRMESGIWILCIILGSGAFVGLMFITVAGALGTDLVFGTLYFATGVKLFLSFYSDREVSNR